MTQTHEKIGFVGLGLMGQGMAKNIVEKGYPLTVVAHRKRAAVDDLVAMAGRWDASASGHLLEGEDVATTLFAFQQEQHVDLILVGTDVRVGSDRLALGRGVEDLIAGASCPVVVVNAP